MVMILAEEFEKIKKEEEENMLITSIDFNKENVINVIDWGGYPFLYEKQFLIPNGFKVQVCSDGKLWIADVMVHKNKAYYRFCFNDKSSGWFPTPTGAYSKAMVLTGGVSQRCNNGKLLIGVTYPNLQREIEDRFPDEYHEMRIQLGLI